MREIRSVASFIVLVLATQASIECIAAEKPNVLFIAIDDLNDWVGCLDGHPQSKTPHMDDLAKRGVLFTNAHCQAPICQPSRSSLLTGTYPWSNGVYDIEQEMREAPLLKDAVTIPQHFRKNGYHTIGAGKIYHRGEGDVDAWDEWGIRHGWGWMGKLIGPEGVSGLPEPSIFDFGPIEVPPEEMNDGRVTTWASEQLQKEYDKPFFLAVGLITPHLPLFTPTEFYDQFPLTSTLLPEVRANDLDDLPPMGLKFTRYFDSTPMSHHNITRHGLWTKAVASYLACSTYTDYCVGQLLAALDKSDHANDTIVVLWSDHGFHIGEKMHWEKRSLWEESTRVPLMIVAPDVTKPGGRCSRPVELIDLFPTLTELCDIPAAAAQQGDSLLPLLKDPSHEWNHPAITTQMIGNHSVRTEHWRYIRYANGDEELYDHHKDPHEFENLAEQSEYAAIMQELAAHLPVKEVPSGPRLPKQKYTQEFDWSRP